MNLPPDDTLPPPDAHLRTALRHAPDADAGPSAALSGRILADARRAVAPRPWGWMRGRPAGAAALASVLLAGFIGLMWRGGPPPPVGPEPSEAASPAVTARADNGQGSGHAADLSSRGASPAPSAAQSLRPELQAVAPVPARPTAPPASIGSRADVSGPARPAAVAAPELREPNDGHPLGPLSQGAERARPPASKAPPAPEGAMAADAAPADPLASIVGRLHADGPLPAAWTDLQALARGRWVPERAAAPTPIGQPVSAADGTVLGWLAWEQGAVLIQPAEGDLRWRASLAPADAARLRAALSP